MSFSVLCSRKSVEGAEAEPLGKCKEAGPCPLLRRFFLKVKVLQPFVYCADGKSIDEFSAGAASEDDRPIFRIFKKRKGLFLCVMLEKMILMYI